MPDVVLVQNGAAHEIFAGRTLSSMEGTISPDLIAYMVEVASGTVAPRDVWDGATFSPSPGPSLEELRSVYRKAIDDDAEACRLKYITAGAGMALTYQEKFAQAQAVAAMGQTDANALVQADREAQFPTLSASIGIEGATLWDCAQLVLAKYAAFAQASLAIERARLSGKAAVSSAYDMAAVRAAYEAVTWPTP